MMIGKDDCVMNENLVIDFVGDLDVVLLECVVVGWLYVARSNKWFCSFNDMFVMIAWKILLREN